MNAGLKYLIITLILTACGGLAFFMVSKANTSQSQSTDKMSTMNDDIWNSIEGGGKKTP